MFLSHFQLAFDVFHKFFLYSTIIAFTMQLYKAAKIILDRPLYSSASHAFATLKWIPLEKRRFQRRCVHVYKCLNGLINHELTLVTQQHQHNYNTRDKVNLRLPCVRRNWGKQRTAYHAVNDFNSLSQIIRDSANVNIFKRQVFNFLI